MSPTDIPQRPPVDPAALQKMLQKLQDPNVRKIEMLNAELERAHQTFRCAMEFRFDSIDVLDMRKELCELQAKFVSALDDSPTPMQWGSRRDEPKA